MKKGFTLMELLAVIIILGVIFAIAVPQVLNVIQNSKIKSLENQAKLYISTVKNLHDRALLNDEDFELIGKCTDLEELHWDDDKGDCIYFIDTQNDETSVTIKGANQFEDLIVYSSLGLISVISNDEYYETFPKITLTGDNIKEIYQGVEYTEDGYIAEDLIDGVITNDVTTTSNLDVDTLGSYKIIYEVLNSNDKKDVVIRTVNVVESPIVTPSNPGSFTSPSSNVNLGSTISVSWNNTSSWGLPLESLNYRLEVSYDGGSYTLVANTNTTNSYNHTVSSSNNTIRYRVRSENSLAQSSWVYSNTYDLVFGCGSSLYDSRDSKSYQTVQIGSQCWFAEDLRFNEGYSTTWNGLGVRTKGSPYNNNGMLYQFNAAMNKDYTPGSQGLCPTGWHVPTNTEWSNLFTAIGGINEANKLKSTIYYSDGTNLSGFNSIPGGYYDIYGTLLEINTHNMWWSSSAGPYRYWIYQGWGSVATSLASANDGFAIRCVLN